MAHLFAPLVLKGLTLRASTASPTTGISSIGSRAVGGAALVFTEATAVTAEGRISPDDLGIWKDDHVEMLERIVRFVHGQGSAAGMQLAHAGRKGSTAAPWTDRAAVPPSAGGWQPIGPTGDAFTSGYPIPRALDTAEIPAVADAFKQAACRALAAGFDVVEIHAAHGYLIRQFLRDSGFGVRDSCQMKPRPRESQIPNPESRHAQGSLRDPYWPLRAARELGHLTPWPVQYLRAAPPGTPAR